MLSVSQDEADRTSERIKFVNEGKRMRGESTNSRLPLGYRLVNRRPSIDPDTENAARDMFAHYIRCRSLCALRRHMLSAWWLFRSYNNWSRMLSNPIYVGVYQGVPDMSPSLISRDDWQLCQDIAAVRGQRCASDAPDRIYLFSGLLFCKECSVSMATSRCSPHGYEYIYYRCRTRMTGGVCDHFKRVREDILEQWLLDNMLPIAKAYNLRISSGQKKKRPDESERIRSKLERLKELYVNDLIDMESYTKDYTVLRQSLEAAQSVPVQTTAAAINLDFLKTALDAYGDLSRLGKKEFWSRTIRRIDADASGNFFVSLR